MSKIKNEYSCALILTNDLIGGKWKLRILWHIVHGEIGMGKDFSKNLGVHYNLVLFMGLTIAAMITASVVVVVGSISYIGLIVPNIVAMMITAYAIGSASIVFQSIINNTIVTSCLLGMDALYTMIHTVLVFILGSGSVLVVNPNYSFIIDLLIMGVTATVIYSYLFKKTKHNVLYVLLIGTVLV